MRKPKEDFIVTHLKEQLDKKTISVDDYYNFLSPKQKQFLYRPNQKIINIIKGGARGGKTAVARFAVPWAVAKLRPDEHGYGFIGAQTIKKGVEFYWDYLRTFCNGHLGLNWKFYKSDHTIKAGNTTIVFFSMGDRESAKFPFGYPTKWVFLEEPQTYNQDILKMFVEEVNMTRLLDFDPDSRVWMMANPSEIPNAYLTWLFKNKEVNTIHVTMHDNPYFKRPEWLKKNGSIKESILKRCRILGITYEESKEYPATARQIWGRDLPDKERRVFWPTEDNLYDKLPEIRGRWERVMGLDIGYEDANAITVIFWNRATNKAYVEHEASFKKQDVESFARYVKEAQMKYNVGVITMDQAGAGAKNMALEMEKRYQIRGIIAAKKTDKKSYIKVLQSETNQRNILFKKSFLMRSSVDNRYPSIYEEMPKIIWNENFADFERKKGYHSDRIAALLYSYRHIHNTYKKTPLKEAVPLTLEEKIRLGMIDMQELNPQKLLRKKRMVGFSERTRKRLNIGEF